MTKTATRVLLLLPLALSGCLEDLSIIKNVTPVAEARIVDPEDDKLVSDLMLPYDGQPVELTLDGSGSSDADGRIVQYIWQSGNNPRNPPDGGIPDGSPPDIGPDDLDPEDVVMPEITVDRGKFHFMLDGRKYKYLFILWVVDNKGATSAPDYVSIEVGDPEPAPVDPPEEDAGSEDDAGS